MVGYGAAYNGDRPDPVGRVNQVLNQEAGLIIFRHRPDEFIFTMTVSGRPKGGAFFDDLLLRIDQSRVPSVRPLSFFKCSKQRKYFVDPVIQQDGGSFSYPFGYECIVFHLLCIAAGCQEYTGNKGNCFHVSKLGGALKNSLSEIGNFYWLSPGTEG